MVVLAELPLEIRLARVRQALVETVLLLQVCLIRLSVNFQYGNLTRLGVVGMEAPNRLPAPLVLLGQQVLYLWLFKEKL
jgi:hypothetical protein